MMGLRDVEVQAGTFVVGPIDLEVRAGEYAVLLGPSGAGKTLVLEAIAGVRRLRAGRIFASGEDITALPPERRGVGLVFQDGLLFPHLSVAHNVAYGLVAARRARRRDLEGHGASRGVAELAAQVGITHLLDRRPATLSGGERQRVALARALAAGPKALLLDEPLSAVDAEAREGLQHVLRRVCRDEGLAVLHVTHDRTEAFALADVCAVIVAGRLRQTGVPRDLLQRPADDAVARIAGARNVLSARRDPRDARVALLEAGGSLRVADPLPAALGAIVVRAEDVHVWRPGGAPAGAGSLLAGVVVRLMLYGGHLLVEVRTPGAVEALLPLRTADSLGLVAGAAVELTVAADVVHALVAGEADAAPDAAGPAA
jgi:molybdate/tungstate transport system ATP-binding protein